MIWLGLPLAALAFLLFGLSFDDHHLRRFGHRCPAQARTAMRRVGWVCVALCFPLAVAMRGWVYGPVVWTGLTMLGAATAFLLLNFAPPTWRLRV